MVASVLLWQLLALAIVLLDAGYNMVVEIVSLELGVAFQVLQVSLQYLGSIVRMPGGRSPLYCR